MVQSFSIWVLDFSKELKRCCVVFSKPVKFTEDNKAHVCFKKEICRRAVCLFVSYSQTLTFDPKQDKTSLISLNEKAVFMHIKEFIPVN